MDTQKVVDLGGGGAWTLWVWGRLPLTRISPASYVSPEGLSPWFHPSSVT